MVTAVMIETYCDTYKDAMIDLILDIQRNEFGVPITREEQPDLENIPDFYQKGNGNFWMALYQDEIVGTIGLIDIGNCKVALRKMFVKAEFRGKEFGIGQSLLQTAIKWSEHRQLHHIYLGTTNQFCAAQKFYEKNGFVEIDKTKLPKSFPAMRLDVKFYHYSL